MNRRVAQPRRASRLTVVRVGRHEGASSVAARLARHEILNAASAFFPIVAQRFASSRRREIPRALRGVLAVCRRRSQPAPSKARPWLFSTRGTLAAASRRRGSLIEQRRSIRLAGSRSIEYRERRCERELVMVQAVHHKRCARCSTLSICIGVPTRSVCKCVHDGRFVRVRRNTCTGRGGSSSRTLAALAWLRASGGLTRPPVAKSG